MAEPILMAIGDSDRRVPPFQAQQYYFALKERGVTARGPPSPSDVVLFYC